MRRAMKNLRRSLSVLLAVAMVLTTVPDLAVIASANGEDGGDATTYDVTITNEDSHATVSFDTGCTTGTAGSDLKTVASKDLTFTVTASEGYVVDTVKYKIGNADSDTDATLKDGKYTISSDDINGAVAITVTTADAYKVTFTTDTGATVKDGTADGAKALDSIVWVKQSASLSFAVALDSGYTLKYVNTQDESTGALTADTDTSLYTITPSGETSVYVRVNAPVVDETTYTVTFNKGTGVSAVKVVTTEDQNGTVKDSVTGLKTSDKVDFKVEVESNYEVEGVYAIADTVENKDTQDNNNTESTTTPSVEEIQAGEKLTATNEVYSYTVASSNATIYVLAKEKAQEVTKHTVTFNLTDATATVQDDSNTSITADSNTYQVTDGAGLSFKVTPGSDKVIKYVGTDSTGQTGAITADANGVYTLDSTAITGDINVYVVAAEQHTITFTLTNATATVGDGNVTTATVFDDENLTFTVVATDGNTLYYVGEDSGLASNPYTLDADTTDTYTLKNVKADKAVYVAAAATKVVTFNATDATVKVNGETVTSVPVAENQTLSFTVELTNADDQKLEFVGYGEDANTAKANKLNDPAEGVYTTKAITENTTIYISVIDKPTYEVTFHYYKEANAEKAPVSATVKDATVALADGAKATVKEGDDLVFTVTPDTHYHVTYVGTGSGYADGTVLTADDLNSDTYTQEKVAEATDIYIKAEEDESKTVTFNLGTNVTSVTVGEKTIASDATDKTVKAYTNENLTFTVTPADTYTVKYVGTSSTSEASGACKAGDAANTYVLEEANITDGVTIYVTVATSRTVTFDGDTDKATVLVNKKALGSPFQTVVADGDTLSFTVSPIRGQEVDKVGVGADKETALQADNLLTAGEGGVYTTKAINADGTKIWVTTKDKTSYDVTIATTNATVTEVNDATYTSGTVKVYEGEDLKIKATADTHYTLSYVGLDSENKTNNFVTDATTDTVTVTGINAPTTVYVVAEENAKKKITFTKVNDAKALVKVGTEEVDTYDAYVGEPLTITVTPEVGNKVTYVGTNSNYTDEKLTAGADNAYTLDTVPNEDTTIYITTAAAGPYSVEFVKADEFANVYDESDNAITAAQSVQAGATFSFKVTAVEGYEVALVGIGANETEAQAAELNAVSGVYTTPAITGDTKIFVKTKAKTTPTLPSGITGEGFEISVVDPEQTYTGSAIKPAVEVYFNGEEVDATAYTVKYSNNVKASHDDKGVKLSTVTTDKKLPTITVTGKGNYSGSQTAYFEIRQLPIDSDDISEGAIVVAENTKVSKVAPVLVYNGVKLTSKDYEITACTNSDSEGTKIEDLKKGAFTAAGTGEITIAAKKNGNYTSSRSIKVTVVESAKLNAQKIAVVVDTKTKLYYNGEEQVPVITVYPNSIKAKDRAEKDKLTEGEDYEIVFSGDKKNVGTVKFTVIGTGDYTGSVTKSYKINAVSTKVSGGTFEVDASAIYDNAVNYTYKSTGVTLGEGDVKVTYTPSGDNAVAVPLEEGKDYKITYSNNKKVSTSSSLAKYTINFIGNYKGNKAIKKDKDGNDCVFAIVPASLSDADVISLDKVYTKKGTYVSKPYVVLDGVVLKASDYTVTYQYKGEVVSSKTNLIELAENEDSAEVTVVVTGKGNYAPTYGSDGEIDATTSQAQGTYTVAKQKTTDAGTALDLSKANIYFTDKDGKKVTKVDYTGDAIELSDNLKLVVAPKGKNAKALEGGYKVEYYINNTNKGKATVVVKSTDSSICVGSKAVTFTITAKNVKK